MLRLLPAEARPSTVRRDCQLACRLRTLVTLIGAVLTLTQSSRMSNGCLTAVSLPPDRTAGLPNDSRQTCDSSLQIKLDSAGAGTA